MRKSDSWLTSALSATVSVQSNHSQTLADHERGHFSHLSFEGRVQDPAVCALSSEGSRLGRTEASSRFHRIHRACFVCVRAFVFALGVPVPLHVASCVAISRASVFICTTHASVEPSHPAHRQGNEDLYSCHCLIAPEGRGIGTLQ